MLVSDLSQQTGGFYNFSNIRYAAPPVGNLRFAAPQSPAVNRSAVNTGSQGRICAQADPAWLAIAEAYIPQYLAGKTNFTPADFANLTSAASSSGIPAQESVLSTKMLSSIC